MITGGCKRADWRWVSLVLVAFCAGCAGLGERVQRADAPAGAPTVERVLGDLAANDAHIQSFRAAGSFVLESPEFDAVKRFRGSIRFRRPADLYVQGNHRLTNIPVFRLACEGPEFLMEFPGSMDQSFYQIEGEQFDDVPFSVSPSDVAREMFVPEDWGALKRRDAHMIAYDAETQTARMSIGPMKSPRRIVDLVRVSASEPRWVPVRNTRLTDQGGVLAITTLGDYTLTDAALFPSEVDAVFPTEATRMTFSMRNVRVNTEVADEYFNIRERARELNLGERKPATRSDTASASKAAR